MKILIFTEGNTTMHNAAKGLPRDEIVKQAKSNEPFVKDYASYIPVGNAVEKISKWASQGAEICYMTSRRSEKEVSDVRAMLKREGFPEGELFFRKAGETYQQATKRAMPDILIEDDCESIGGEEEMISPKLDPGLGIKAITTKEFGGIDKLPDSLSDLQKI
jgi:hypothetical protein